MEILLVNKFLYPKGGDAICTLAAGELLRAHGHEVVFWGMKNEKDPAYPHRDLFADEADSLFLVIPSEWYENNPRSVIESFALGTPVIGARIGGIPELVKDHETGLTFEPGNARDLADKIRTLAGQP